MSNVNAQAEQARETARQTDGKFGSWEAEESGVSLASTLDVGDQAYDDLTPDEQDAWHAWREMTGKSEETVVGQAQAEDIAEFKKHHLASGSDDGLPSMETARRLGLSSDEQEALHQWDEMVSAGTIEQHHDDETGEFHSFAHPHLARTMGAGGQALAPADSDDDDLDLEEGWEDIEPDFDDYTFRSQDAVMQGGLSSLQHGEIYWDQEQAFASASEVGRSGSVGFDARGGFDEVETDYLPEDLAERVQRHAGGRELNIASYSPSTSRTQCGENNQFVSVSLNEAERNAVVDHLNNQDKEEFNEDLVDYWEAGEPAQANRTFGFVSPKREWDRVSEAVRERAPDAAHALETAEDLRREANKSFEAEVDHMNSDGWKKEEARRRNGFD